MHSSGLGNSVAVPAWDLLSGRLLLLLGLLPFLILAACRGFEFPDERSRGVARLLVIGSVHQAPILLDLGA